MEEKVEHLAVPNSVFRGLTRHIVAVGLLLAAAAMAPTDTPLIWGWVIAGFTCFALVVALLVYLGVHGQQSFQDRRWILIGFVLGYGAIISANAAPGNRFSPLVVLFLTPVLYEAVAKRGPDVAVMVIGLGAVAFGLTSWIIGLQPSMVITYTVLNTLLTIIVFRVFSFYVAEMRVQAGFANAVAALAETVARADCVGHGDCVAETLHKSSGTIKALTGATTIHVAEPGVHPTGTAETISLPSGRTVVLEGMSDRSHLAVLSDLLTMLDERVRLFDELETQSITDPLTGLLNRRALTGGRRSTDSDPVCVAVLDMDHFKRFNDTYGHAAGDVLLREFSAAMVVATDARDQVVRLGGEEFCITMRGCLETATETIEALRRDWQEHGQGTTFSVGIARLATGEDHACAIARADEAMYKAKRAGRDRVVAAAAFP